MGLKAKIRHRRGNRSGMPAAYLAELLFALDTKEIFTSFDGTSNTRIFSFQDLLPVGTSILVDSNLPGTPVPGNSWAVENGQMILNADSPYNGKRIRNLVGAVIILTVLSFSNTLKTVTFSLNDIFAVNVWDKISGTGIPANSFVLSVNYSTGTVQLGSTATMALTTGTLTAVSSVNITGEKRFLMMDSVSGISGWDTVQTHQHSLGVASTGTLGTAQSAVGRSIAPTQQINTGNPSSGRTAADTKPVYSTKVPYIKIK